MEKYFKELDVVGRTYEFRVIAGLHALETWTHEKLIELENKMDRDFIALSGLLIRGVTFESGGYVCVDVVCPGWLDELRSASKEHHGVSIESGRIACDNVLKCITHDSGNIDWDNIMLEDYPRPFTLPNESQRIFNGFEDI